MSKELPDEAVKFLATQDCVIRSLESVAGVPATAAERQRRLGDQIRKFRRLLEAQAQGELALALAEHQIRREDTRNTLYLAQIFQGRKTPLGRALERFDIELQEIGPAELKSALEADRRAVVIGCLSQPDGPLHAMHVILEDGKFVAASDGKREVEFRIVEKLPVLLFSERR